MKKQTMRRAVMSSLIAIAALGSTQHRVPAGGPGGGGEPLILPQMFNVAAGDSTVVLQNLSAAQQDLTVEFFEQDGDFFSLVTASVAGLGEAQVPTPGRPGGYEGSVLIFGNAPFAARGQWNFNVQGNPLAVGVPALAMSRTSNTFHVPVGSVGANSLVGVAIENPGGTAIDCAVSYRDQTGTAVAEDAFTAIPGFGQVTGFATGIAAGFEGSGTVTCNGAAAVVAVIQEQVNGFPTPLFAVPAN